MWGKKMRMKQTSTERFLTRAIVNQNDQNSIFIKSPVASIIQRQISNKSR